MVVSEYYGRFGTGTRTGLFYTFILLNLFILGRYIIIPLLKLNQIGKTITDEQAANIIGNHFGEIKDKLLNTLQLKAQAEANSSSLLLASIEQRTKELKPIPFVNAVDSKANKKYLKYALIPLGVLFILLIQSPNMLVESTNRLVKHNTFFVEEAPFKFILENEKLNAIRQEDYVIKLKIKGKEIPAEVYAVVDGNAIKMSPKSKTTWTYTMRNLQKDIGFRFDAAGFSSQPYELKVMPKPFLQKFEIRLQYPNYIGKKDDVLNNTGDLTIPQGTVVSWKFFTENTESLHFLFGKQEMNADRKGENLYQYKKVFTKDDEYLLKIGNKYLQNSDSIKYSVTVIPDAYPSIEATQENDTSSLKNLYFTGQASDDYGIQKVTFNYHYTKSEDSAKKRIPLQTVMVAGGNKPLLTFYHFWDANAVNIQPGDEIEYYFEAWDNDGVNGSKSARSAKLVFKAPSLDELEKKNDNSNKSISNKIESAIRQSAKLQKEMQEARERLLNKKNLDYQDKKMVEDILKKQQNLQNTVKELKEEYTKNSKEQNEFKKADEELLEKQKNIQEMFDKLMDEDTKKMMDDLKKLLDENMKDDIQKQMEEMKFQDKEVQKELDRMAEVFKQYAFEQKLQQNIDKLDKLSEEQQKLATETEQKKGDAKEETQKQDSLNKKFEDVKQDMKELQQKNEELENKNNLENTEKQQQDIQKEMQESKENLQKQQNKKASQNQKKAAQKMKELSDKMKEAQEKSSEKDGEDYAALRQILSNLMYVSFEQEKLMSELKVKSNYSPEFIEISKRQRKLRDDAKMIEDSLQALSKRVIEIKSFVNKEIGLVNHNMDLAIEDLGDRNTPSARTHQQYVMTSVNNLAVMLSEVLKQMNEQQKESKSQKPGEKQCKKPGKKKGKGQGKPKPGSKSMQSMKEMQQQLNKELQAMKNGKNGKPGSQMSKELAQIAARQEAIRRELQRINAERNKGGKKPLGDLDGIQKMMDKTEEDLVNKRLTDETMKRQQDIMVKMLESEKAEKQQDEEEKRESKTANNNKNQSPPSFEKYKALKEKEVELLRTVPPNLNPYYRAKVKDYFQGMR
ncbi:MAG: DUF4175 family protein [Bacteroidetes bacterium]|nr:DUF4175 family protein [Bacteroidota bacterium]